MTEGKAPRRSMPAYRAVLVLCLLGAGILLVLFRSPIRDALAAAYAFLTDHRRVEGFIAGYGPWAPLVFIGLQILQVVLAPVPGEASGFIGGFVFGAWRGFLYSSIGLAVGSWVNFSIGRFLGEHWVRRLIPADKWQRIDRLVKRQGVILIFLLFVFPGFPKDYLCLFLGLTHLPIRIFVLLSSVGRMPGTFMLSLQGASLFERNYWIFGALLGSCLLAALLAWRYRDPLYRWVERLNHLSPDHRR